MDKKTSKVREYLATQAELVGAIRLPNTTFAEAGTGVTADIIFLKFPSINYMPYHTTINLVETVIKNGETVYHKEW